MNPGAGPGCCVFVPDGCSVALDGPGSSRNGRSVHFSYGYFTFANYYRFFGLSVRPVAD